MNKKYRFEACMLWVLAVVVFVFVFTTSCATLSPELRRCISDVTGPSAHAYIATEDEVKAREWCRQNDRTQ